MIEARITGMNRDGEITYRVTSNEISNNFTHSVEDAGEFTDVIERIWAYFTIKGLLERKAFAETRVSTLFR